MEISLRVPLEGEVVRDGAVVLPARLLVDVVRALPADELTLELRAAEQDVELNSGSATFHIRTLRLEDFPPLPEPGGDDQLDVPGPALVETVAQGGARGVARRDAAGTDRHPRLRHRAGAADGRDRLLPPVGQGHVARRAADGAFEANVPARALQELTRIVQHAEADTDRRPLRSNQVVFEVGGVMLSSRLIDGQFPNGARSSPRRTSTSCALRPAS